jgi:hypothetical protein
MGRTSYPGHGKDTLHGWRPCMEQFISCTSQEELNVGYRKFTSTIWDVAKEWGCITIPRPNEKSFIWEKKRECYAKRVQPLREQASGNRPAGTGQDELSLEPGIRLCPNFFFLHKINTIY